jgi:hypothetical protein
MTVATLSRRDLLRIAGAAAATATVGAGCSDSDSVAPATVSAPFFSADLRAAADAMADVVIPPDDQPGGAALGASNYIEKLFSAFEAGAATPPIFAGGPYSGRTPFDDGNGHPSTNFPPNDFATFLPMDRVTTAAIRLMLYGSEGFPNGGPNDKALGQIVGLRDLVKNGLNEAIGSSKAALATLTVAERMSIFIGLDQAFQDAWIDLVCQAAWSPPEYGGNPNLAGWKMIHFEGDSVPLGYSLFDLETGSYVERPDAPLSTPNPGPDPEPMDADTEELIAAVAILAGGKVFS